MASFLKNICSSKKNFALVLDTLIANYTKVNLQYIFKQILDTKLIRFFFNINSI